MSTRVYNEKHHTCNIYIVKLLLLLSGLGAVSVPLTAESAEKQWVVVIDAGHGGYDPGALGSFSAEKNITLAIALRTGSYIEKNIKNVKVIYTRKSDVFVELKDRPAIANKNNADLFISIHANSTNSKNVHGTETYIMGITKDQQNLEVAMKENEVILLEKDYSTSYEGFDPKSPESYVMFSLMQNIYQSQSTAFASKIQTEYRDQIDRLDRGVKQAGFWVLYMTTMPSILTETGFITNPDEEKYLNSTAGQDKIASAIFNACRDYISDIESRSSKFPIKRESRTDNMDNDSQRQLKAGEINFMVQIISSSTRIEINPQNFNGLKNVTEIPFQGYFKYATGNFSDYQKAVDYRREIESSYPDAFIIAVRDNKIIPLQQALDQMK